MSNHAKLSNGIALALLLLGFICYYVLPGPLQLLTDIILFVAVFVHSQAIWGASRTVIYMVIAMVIGYLAEFIGINTGLVFGVYHYNVSNPAMIFGVPLTIPVLYAVLLYAANLSWIAISNRLLLKKNLWLLSLFTGFILALKDVITDPLQSTVHQAWIWNNGGAYFGVPIHNFWGWFAVFVIITFIALNLAWHREGFSEKIHYNKTNLLFPILLFIAFILFGVTDGLMVPKEFSSVGSVSVFIALLCFIPYFLLVWFNGFHKD